MTDCAQCCNDKKEIAGDLRTHSVCQKRLEDNDRYSEKTYHCADQYFFAGPFPQKQYRGHVAEDRSRGPDDRCIDGGRQLQSPEKEDDVYRDACEGKDG